MQLSIIGRPTATNTSSCRENTTTPVAIVIGFSKPALNLLPTQVLSQREVGVTHSCEIKPGVGGTLGTRYVRRTEMCVVAFTIISGNICTCIPVTGHPIQYGNEPNWNNRGRQRVYRGHFCIPICLIPSATDYNPEFWE